MTLWTRGVVVLLMSAVMVAALSVGVALSAVRARRIHIYLDRRNLPDLGPFTRFEFPTIGHVYDTNGQPLVGSPGILRRIKQYQGRTPIVRDAILATEDKHSMPRSRCRSSRRGRTRPRRAQNIAR